MPMIVALAREVSRSIADCELTHVERTPIDLAVARAQHASYLDALETLGVRVVRLPELADSPTRSSWKTPFSPSTRWPC